MARRSSLTPGFGWNERAGRYVRLDGSQRFVSWERTVRPALDSVVLKSQDRLRELAQQLRGRTIALADFEVAFFKEIKTAHVASAALAAGGWAQMTPADYGRVGAKIRAEYGFARDLCKDIEAGKVKLDGRFIQRVASYGNAGTATFEAEHRRREIGAGARWERNVLGVADHCNGCLAETAKGWVPVGTLVPVGSRDCLNNDECHIEYSRSLTRPA